jgi:hypothetical protein
VSGRPSDLEDLFEPSEYLECFNRAYASQLKGSPIAETDLPPGDRIIDRIERYLAANAISVRPTPGFNHYLPASAFAASPPVLSSSTLSGFEQVFNAVNALF